MGMGWGPQVLQKELLRATLWANVLQDLVQIKNSEGTSLESLLGF